jgi:hypothetical protein
MKINLERSISEVEFDKGSMVLSVHHGSLTDNGVAGTLHLWVSDNDVADLRDFLSEILESIT